MDEATLADLIVTMTLLLSSSWIGSAPAWAQNGTGRVAPVQPGAPVASFKSSVDLVRVSAVVRDKKGRFVRDLSARDFHVLDDGLARTITDFRHDLAGVSVAVLFDVSGSMEDRMVNARDTATHMLGWLDKERDEAGFFTFDTRLTQLTPFTTGLQAVPRELDLLTPFGATGLHDAIAQTAHRMNGRESRRRAIVVLTDGVDNASRLSASEVSGIASAIDVPVYVVGIVPSIDNPAADHLGAVGRQVGAGGLVGRPRRMDRWPLVCGQHAGRAQRRRPPDCGRAAASISDRV